MRETRVLRHRPVFDLKWSLLKQIAAVALLCFLGGAALSVHRAAEEVSKANQSVGDAVGRFLEMPLVFHLPLQPALRKRMDLQQRFREMDPFLDQVMSPGQCVQLNEAGKDAISSCLGFQSQVGEAPAWFSAFYRRAVGSRMTSERAVMDQGLVLGTVVVSSNLLAVTARA
jgi:two-component system sensor histidine kinase UhpB